MRNQGCLRCEIEKSRLNGKPTESLGRQLLALCWSIAQKHEIELQRRSIEDAVSSAVFYCLKGWSRIGPDWGEDDVANFFVTTAINTLRNATKIESRRKKHEANLAIDFRPDRCYSRKGPR